MMPQLAGLSLSPSPSSTAATKEEKEISPVIPLEAPVPVPEPEPETIPQATPDVSDRHALNVEDDDIYKLDNEGWARVAKASGIEEMLKLGEGISGSVSKCRLRKSGQVFAIKVRLHCRVEGNDDRLLRQKLRLRNIYFVN